MDCWKVLDPGEVVLRISQGLVVDMVFYGKPSTGVWIQEMSLRDGEGIMRHPSSVWFCDHGTNLDKITVW